MKEHMKNPQNKPMPAPKKDFSKPLDLGSHSKEGSAVKPHGYVNPSKSAEFKTGANKSLGKSNYNDHKNPKGGCGCS